MKLYPHQQGQVDAIVSQAKAKRNRLVIGSATGTGKSVTIAELCKLARRPLVIAPTLNLMYQMHETLVKVLGRGH
jgi:superfamily II DNA or RNA helicase